MYERVVWRSSALSLKWIKSSSTYRSTCMIFLYLIWNCRETVRSRLIFVSERDFCEINLSLWSRSSPVNCEIKSLKIKAHVKVPTQLNPIKDKHLQVHVIVVLASILNVMWFLTNLNRKFQWACLIIPCPSVSL